MSQTQVSFAGFAKWAMCPETEVPCGSCPSEGLPCQAALYLRQTECPPAGASQEVNEAEPGLAAPSASGQQAGTPIASVAAVDTLLTGRLDDLWLPAFRRERESLVVMDAMCKRSFGKPRYDAFNTARCAVLCELDRTVSRIVERGGLLLCV